MDEALINKSDYIKQLRFKYDNETLSGNGFQIDEIVNEILHSELLIDSLISPRLDNILSVVCEKLDLKREDVKFFVYNSAAAQASCISCGYSHCVIRISSSLVNLLDEDELSFVLGHELGHWVFSHSVDPKNNDLHSLRLKRYQEVSADRAGYVACGSLDAAIRATMKVVSGLGVRDLRFDVRQFISQIKQANAGAPNSAVLSSHPTMLIRARALVWFSLSDICLQHEAGGKKLSEIDEIIKNDISHYIEKGFDQQVELLRSELQMWVYINQELSTQRFSKKAQEYISVQYGMEILHKLIALMETDSREGVLTIVQGNILSLEESLDQLGVSRGS